MRTIRVGTCDRFLARAAATAVVTLVIGSSGIAAQERPAGLLNKLDVRVLVARGDPVDHDRLFVHFRVLRDRYLTDAGRHDSMARTFMGNPNRSSGGGTSEHCKQLANINRQSAKTLRQLARYHEQLAEGTPATLPPGAAPFQGGAGAPDPTEQELDALVARARSRTDHLALEEYLRVLAKGHHDEADEHLTMASVYRGGRFAQAAVHHEHVANLASTAATEATRAADLHRQLSTVAR